MTSSHHEQRVRALYARYLGLGLIALGVLGLSLGEDPLFGWINLDLRENLVHLVTGALLAYAGFQSEAGVVQRVVRGVGVLYLIVGIVGFASPSLLGLLSHGYSMADNLIHAVLGAITIGAARSCPSQAGFSEGRASARISGR